MKTLTVRLPTPLVAAIEAESRARRISKSDVVRERLGRGPQRAGRAVSADPLAAIADIIGSVDGGPEDLSSQVTRRLRATGYGKNRPR